MLHCKNSRPEKYFKLFVFLLKMRLKFQSTLKEQYDTQWAINHGDALLAEFGRSLWPLLSELQRKKLLTSRPLHPSNDSIVPSFFFFFAAVRDSRRSPPAMSSCDVVGLFTAITQIFCLFLPSDAFF